jgi:hypothetical protein
LLHILKLANQEEKMKKDRHQRKWAFGLSWVIVNTFSWALYTLVAMAAGWVMWEAYQYLRTERVMRFLSDESNRIWIAVVILGVCWGAIIGFFQQLVLKQRFDLEGRTWILATLIGVTIYIILRTSVSSFAVNIAPSRASLYVINILGTFACSTALGIAQWLILRQYFSRSGWWIVATVIALGIPSLATSTFFGGGGKSFLLSSVVSLAVEGLIYGLITLIALTLISKQSSKSA